jgi:hypothetical protein
MNEGKDSQVSDGNGEVAAPAEANPASGCREGGMGRGDVAPILAEPTGNLPRRAGVMNVVLKRALLAAALFATCAVILAAVKTYGVWVLSGIAVALFGLGLLRKEKKPSGSGDGRETTGDRKEP